MISYDDPKWKKLKGGYGTLYDPTPVLKKLETQVDSEDAWSELWDELHHQGDLGEASYAAVPHLVRIAETHNTADWNCYALVSLIEVERHNQSNPGLPSWLEHDYHDAWKKIPLLVTSRIVDEEDLLTTRAMLGALAIAKGLREYGTLITCFDHAEIIECLEYRLDWTKNNPDFNQ